jgi:tetratricopeptide (TPR) repeat protein
MLRPFLPLVAVFALAGAAEAERTPLIAIEYDRIHLTSGQNLMGLVVAEDNNGTLKIEVPGQKNVQSLPKAMWTTIERRRSLAGAIQRRGDEAIAAADWVDVARVMRFANERQQVAEGANDAALTSAAEVREAGLIVATKALAARPLGDVAALALPLAEAAGQPGRIIAIAKAGIAADPNWSAGHAALVKAFRAAGDAAATEAAVATWLARQPTALAANRELATVAEERGDLKTAQEAWRKGYDLHQDLDCALGLARTAMRRGDPVEAERAARVLVESPRYATAGRVFLGAALLRREADLPIATTALEQALAAPDLDPELADVARYDLGLLRARGGKMPEAEALWRQVKHPAAKLALARLGNERLDPAQMPPALRALASEQEAVSALLVGDPAPAMRLDPKATRRAWELQQYAQVLRTKGAEESLKTIASLTSIEAQRWVAWGHLTAGRLAQAEAVLERLPPNDGWAISARVFIAAERKDDVAARDWYARLATADAPPSDYVARLAAEFASANDEELHETFDWPDAEVAPTGWQASAPGTGIRIRARDGRLVLDGTQDAEGVSRVYRLVQADRLRGAQVMLDNTGVSLGTVALEILDEARANGVALGSQDGKPGWRELKAGAWGPWTQLPFTLAPGTALRLEADAGRLWATPLADPAHRVSVSNLRPEGAWAIGISVTAPSGVTLSLAADDLIIQLRPATRRQ